MGSACEESLGKAIQAITTRNSDIAENVIQDDEKIDKYEALIEQQVVNLIALRQPMAIDLRETVTALKMSSDLERIGDLAKNISKRTLLLNENLPKNLVDSLNRVSTKFFGRFSLSKSVLFDIFFAKSPILSKSEDIFKAVTVSLKSIAIGCLKAIKFTTCCSIKDSYLSIFSSSWITASAKSLFLVVMA